MNKRFLGVLIFSLVVALAASTVVYRLISARTAVASPPPTGILLAAHDLPVGTLLKDSDVSLAHWPGAPPAQSIAKLENATGRGVIANIYAGEPVLESRLAQRGAGAGLAATIPSGMRAVAVRVNEFVGVAGFVVPGMRVDILISGLAPGGTNSTLGTQTRTILQNIEVLSAGQKIQKDAEGKPITVPVVNLLVTPEQAETLSLASNETKIQLVLRNPLDTQQAKAPGTAMAYLFGGQPTGKSRPAGAHAAAKPKPKPAPPAPVMEEVAVPLTMEIILGAKKETVSVGQKFVERAKEIR